MGTPKKTANFQITATPEGNVYRFFCDLSGAVCAETPPYRDPDPERERMLAWETSGKEQFNLCHKCGRWVADVMYNPDVYHCVECSPIEDIPNFCPNCGEKLAEDVSFCPKCGGRLMYGGEYDEGCG